MTLLQAPTEKIAATVKSLALHHAALHGQLDTDVAITGSVDQPEVSGDVTVSHGSVVVSSQTASSLGAKGKDTSKAARGSGGSAAQQGLSGSKQRGLDVGVPAPSAAGASQRDLFASQLQSQHAARGFSVPSHAEAQSGGSAQRTSPQQARADTAEASAANFMAAEAPAALKPLQLRSLRIKLGPDLRVSSFPFLQLNVSGKLRLSGSPVDIESMRATGAIHIGPGTVNAFATQFTMDRGRDSRITFAGDPANPHIDVAMSSREFRLACDAAAKDASHALTITRLSDGSTQTIGQSGAPLVFEAQLRSLLLEQDGGLAVQSAVMNALSTMLPRVEGAGRFGNAQWRLVGAAAHLSCVCELHDAAVLLPRPSEAVRCLVDRMTAASGHRCAQRCQCTMHSTDASHLILVLSHT